MYLTILSSSDMRTYKRLLWKLGRHRQKIRYSKGGEKKVTVKVRYE
jgi:hypothetical protein